MGCGKDHRSKRGFGCSIFRLQGNHCQRSAILRTSIRILRTGEAVCTDLVWKARYWAGPGSPDRSFRRRSGRCHYLSPRCGQDQNTNPDYPRSHQKQSLIPHGKGGQKPQSVEQHSESDSADPFWASHCATLNADARYILSADWPEAHIQD